MKMRRILLEAPQVGMSTPNQKPEDSKGEETTSEAMPEEPPEDINPMPSSIEGAETAERTNGEKTLKDAVKPKSKRPRKTAPLLVQARWIFSHCIYLVLQFSLELTAKGVGKSLVDCKVMRGYAYMTSKLRCCSIVSNEVVHVADQCSLVLFALCRFVVQIVHERGYRNYSNFVVAHLKMIIPFIWFRLF